MSLKFAANTHRYWMDGKPVQGVTTLIKGGLPAPALTYWSAKTVAEWVADNPQQVEDLRAMGRGPMVAALKETPWQARDEAGNRGTEVHGIAEKLIRGEEVDVPEAIAGHVESCVRFLDEWKIEPQLVECSVGNRSHWWAGRLDVLDTDGVLWDYKTSRSGIFAETAFQLAAYSHAEFYVTDDDIDTEHPMPEVTACRAVWIRGDGYDVIPVNGGDETYKKFRHLAHVAKFAKTAKADLIGVPLMPPTLTLGATA